MLLLVLTLMLVLVFRAVILAPETPRPGGTYTEGVVGEIAPLNPLFATEASTVSDVNALLFEPLVRVLPSGQIAPVLAARWEVSPDLRSYTFNLRGNARWSDGSSVSADDVVFTVRTVQDPQFPGAVLNASWKDIIATAIDSSHVRFALPGKNAGFMATLELLDIVPGHLLGGRSIADLAAQAQTLNPVGTGPFRLAKRLPDRLLLERNPFAWRPPWLDTVVLRTFSSQDAALDALDRGQIDGIANLSTGGLARVGRNHEVATYAASTYEYAELIMNLRPDAPLFQDVQVRKAIAMAIDKTAIIRDTLHGQAHAEDGPTPHAITWAYDAATQPPGYDPAGAGKLLDADGWLMQTNGVRAKNGSPLAFNLTVSADLSPYQRVAEKVAMDLSRIGVDANVQPVSTAALIHDYLSPRTFDMVLIAFDNGPDPDVFAFWHSSQEHPGGFNFTSMKRNVFIDKYLEDGRSALDLPTRVKAYNRLQEQFAKDVPAVYLYSPIFNFAVDRRIHGVRLDSAVEPQERYAHVSDWYVEVGR